MPGAPEMSVIVLSYREEPTLLDCVDSLLEQGEGIEVIVSHSGGPAPSLGERPGVKLAATSERRLTGAARNAGVEASSAPFVAFLAADCLAAPGWVEGRLRRHRAGAAAVGTAVAPAEASLITRALWLYEHSGRMPLPASGLPIQHGASYSREMLDRFGPFDDSELGEDTRFNIKLMDAGVEFEWAPDVVALHHYPTTLRGALRDCYARGQRKIRSRGTGFWPQARDPILSVSKGVWRGLRPGSPVTPAQVGAALPLLVAYAAASYGGLLSGG